jgi:hypothetical protein
MHRNPLLPVLASSGIFVQLGLTVGAGFLARKALGG